jgi:hypothetical protein
MATVNIKGLDKVALLKKMWENTQPASFFSLCPQAPVPTWDIEAAAKVISDGGIDYFQGRAIKADLSGDEVDSRRYNRQAGEDVLERIVKSMRTNEDVIKVQDSRENFLQRCGMTKDYAKDLVDGKNVEKIYRGSIRAQSSYK